MRYWFDTEFDEDGRTIQLISIALVAEDGRVYHAVSNAYDWHIASDWLRENVLAQIANEPRISRARIRDDILSFVGGDVPEFWAYFGEYDWVDLRQLFGHIVSPAWPRHWPLGHLDIEQLRLSVGGPPLPAQESRVHHALNDALWAKVAWEFLSTHRGALHGADNG